MNEDRDTKLFASLIYLADTLVVGYDVIDVADAMVATCGELLPIDAAGIMVDDRGRAWRRWRPARRWRCRT